MKKISWTLVIFIGIIVFMIGGIIPTIGFLAVVAITEGAISL